MVEAGVAPFVIAQSARDLQTIDWVIVLAYFAVVGVIAWWASRAQDDSEDYFLAGRNVGWFVIGGSLFASNIGSEHLVGLAGSGATDGIIYAHYELHAWILLVLGWVFLPFYVRSGVFTMPEFLEKRFGPGARWIVTLVSLIAYILTKVAVTLFAAGIVFRVLFPDVEFLGADPFWIGAIGTLLLTGLYTVAGGLRAVLYTDALQAFTLIIGSIATIVIGLNMVGGPGELVAAVGAEQFSLWRPLSDPDFPWLGVLFGAPIVGLWYWCTDQYIVQRTLAARNITIGRRATIFASVLKITPVFLFIIPGMIAATLKERGSIDFGGANEAFPALMLQVLPVGLRGLALAGLLAALMSSLSSTFNSSATLFTVDIYKKWRPDADERRTVTVGRLATGAVVVLGLLWIPFIPGLSDNLYEYLQNVQSYLAPPLIAIFGAGIFTRRINAAGAVASLATGFVLGIGKLFAEVYATGLGDAAEDATGVQGLVVTYGSFNFLYTAIALFIISVIVMYVASVATEPPPEHKLEGLTFATTAKGEITYTRTDVIASAIVLTIILSLYVYFSGLFF
ncbi:MAG TPA: sodium:solute symporter [Euzebyales bacterium]|nr:sodium:solute symporter [Euzebyales bacterium]